MKDKLTIVCEKGMVPNAFSDSKCIDEKEKENKACDPTKPPPATINCKPCMDTSTTITMARTVLDIGEIYCKNKENFDFLVALLVHEASHNCVGPHDYKMEGDGPSFLYVKGGVAYNRCHRPDSYSVEIAFRKCHDLKPGWLWHIPSGLDVQK